MDHSRSGRVRSLGRSTASVVSSHTETATFDRVAVKIREIQRRIEIERTMAIGELVTHQSLKDDRIEDEDSVRSTNDTIRELAGRSDCPLSKTALRRAVGIYAVLVDIPRVKAFGNISLRHIIAVLPLSTEDRRRVLEEAQRDALSVRETKALIRQLRRDGKRQPHGETTNFEHAVVLADRGVREVAQAIARVTRDLDPSAASSDALKTIVSELQRQVESLEDWSNSSVSGTKHRSLTLVEGEARDAVRASARER